MNSGNLFQPLPYIMQGGHRRLLACLPPKADFGGMKKLRDSVSILPRSEWVGLNRRSIFPPSTWILDQDGIGSCVGNGSASALRKARFLAGQRDVELSPGCLYAQINGGSDNGAVISDALTALEQTGTCAFATVGETPYFLPQLPTGWKEEASRFRIGQAYHCQSFDEIGTALQCGFLVVYGIMVGNDFEQFDANGIAGWTSGPGNHCMHADGMIQLPDGRWLLDNCNSWGSTWGPWGIGRCYLSEDHFLHGDAPDAFAIEAATIDPKEPQPPAAR